MAAGVIYTFDYIRAGESAGVYLHGLGDGFLALGMRLQGGLVPYTGPVTSSARLRADEFSRHVDQTMARTIYVDNLSNWGIRAEILSFDAAVG